MASSSTITVHDVKVIGLVAPLIAAVVTLIRLFERIRLKRFGIDDIWAAFSLIILILFVVALFIHLGDPTHLSHSTKVAMYYILAQGFYGIVWAARMSILFSVVRITPQGSIFKKILYGLAVSFFCVWSILFAQVFWVCENEPLWKDNISPQCALGRNVAIAQLISDIYADSILIVTPLRLLWNLDVPRSQRNRLFLVFTASIATTIASLVHAYYVLRVGGLDEVFVAIIEDCVSLLVCNLAVIVGLGSRLITFGRQNFGSSVKQSVPSRTRAITTIGGTATGPINVMKVDDVHTDVDSISPDDDSKVHLYQLNTYTTHGTV